MRRACNSLIVELYSEVLTCHLIFYPWEAGGDKYREMPAQDGRLTSPAFVLIGIITHKDLLHVSRLSLLCLVPCVVPKYIYLAISHHRFYCYVSSQMYQHV
jgi:hypothetical protein